MTLLGAYVDTDATVDAGGVPLETGGVSWQFSPRYTIPLRRAPENMNHEIEFGFDFKSSNNNLEFGEPISTMSRPTSISGAWVTTPCASGRLGRRVLT